MPFAAIDPDLDTAPPETSPELGSLRSSWPLILATAAACVLIMTSVVVVVLCSGRGFDVTDEGFYLLSYRWWNENYDNFTGAQYFLGPVFELLGFDIAHFRVFRIVALVGAHAFFALCFMAWLRTARPTAPRTPLWTTAGAGAIVACSPAVYTWLPLSIGYNDVALICSLALAGCVLRIARDQELGRRAAWWAPFGIGAVAVVLVLSKWSSSLAVMLGLLVTLVTITASRRLGIRTYCHLSGWLAVGVISVVGILQFALVPLGTLVPPLLEINRLVASSSNSPGALIVAYGDGFLQLLESVVRLYWPLLLVALAAPFLRRRRHIGVASVTTAVALGVYVTVRDQGLLGGPVHVGQSITTLYAPVVASLVAALANSLSLLNRPRGPEVAWPPRLRRWALLAMIAGMPIAQAAGTGNWIHKLAVIGVGFWMALIVHLFTGLDGQDAAMRLLIGSMAAFLAIATTCVAVSALWSYPYRTTGHAVSTSAVRDLPALDSLRLAPNDATDFAMVHEMVRDYVPDEGRPMIAFDRLAGLVLALNGRPVGESWYSSVAPDRARKGIIRTCEGHRWWGQENKPLVFFNRKPVRADFKALETCGIRLRTSAEGPKNYSRETVRFRGAWLRVFLPQ